MNKRDYLPYYSSDYFKLESDLIFSKFWVFACSTIDLPKSNSYYLVKMPFGEIIISRDNDQFYAFHNKCLHRGHPLVNKQRGESVFTCPYHNWCYSANGGLLHVPDAEKFYHFKDEDYVFEHLQRVAIHRIGDFLFINASNDPMLIDDQFDQQVLENLEKTREKLGSATLTLSIDLNFNWKLIFENLRDLLHPAYLHPKSLTQEVTFFANDPICFDKNLTLTKIAELSSFSKDGVIKNNQANYKNDFLICDDGQHYLNWLLFPFTHIPSPDGGVLYSVENYVPINASQTRLDLHLYITKSIGKTSPLAILYNWMQKVKIVLKEDFEAVSAIQRVATQSQQSQTLGAYEMQNLRIHKFLEKYLYD